MKKTHVIAAAFLLSSVVLFAEKASPGWTLSQSLGASVNPLGLEAGTRVFYTTPLFPDKAGVLWDSARIEAGLHNSLTPAYDSFSVFLRFEPAAFFDLHLSAGVRGYYDLFAFGYTPLAGYDSPFDSSTRADADRKETVGFRYSATPTVKAAAGSFIFASTTGFVLLDMRGAETSEDYYFAPFANAVLKKFGGYLTNDTLIMYDFGREILGGVSHYYLYVFDSEYVSQRLTLVGHAALPLGRNLTGSLSVTGGVFLRSRYYGIRDGKVYAAVQAGVAARL